MMTNFQFYSRIVVADAKRHSRIWDEGSRAYVSRKVPMSEDARRRWLTRQPHDPLFAHCIPAVVTPQDCRHLFLLESQLTGPAPALHPYNAVVVVGGVRVPIVWDYEAVGVDPTCSPVVEPRDDD